MKYLSVALTFAAGAWAGKEIAVHHFWGGIAVVAFGMAVAFSIIGHAQKKG